MSNNKWEWYEVWADDSPVHVYLLLVYKIEESNFIVLDPKENHKVLFQSKDYEEIQLWLAEDEYSLIDGRMHNEL